MIGRGTPERRPMGAKDHSSEVTVQYSVPVAMRYGREQVAVFAQGDASDGPYTVHVFRHSPCLRLTLVLLCHTMPATRGWPWSRGHWQLHS